MNQNFEEIPVKIDKGMFADECSVVIELADGKEVSLFVDCDLIVNRGDRKFLRVPVASRDPIKKSLQVLLPAEAFETMSCWANVPQPAMV